MKFYILAFLFIYKFSFAFGSQLDSVRCISGSESENILRFELNQKGDFYLDLFSNSNDGEFNDNDNFGYYSIKFDKNYNEVWHHKLVNAHKSIYPFFIFGIGFFILYDFGLERSYHKNYAEYHAFAYTHREDNGKNILNFCLLNDDGNALFEEQMIDTLIAEPTDTLANVDEFYVHKINDSIYQLSTQISFVKDSVFFYNIFKEDRIYSYFINTNSKMIIKIPYYQIRNNEIVEDKNGIYDINNVNGDIFIKKLNTNENKIIDFEDKITITSIRNNPFQDLQIYASEDINDTQSIALIISVDENLGIDTFHTTFQYNSGYFATVVNEATNQSFYYLNDYYQTPINFPKYENNTYLVQHYYEYPQNKTLLRIVNKQIQWSYSNDSLYFYYEDKNHNTVVFLESENYTENNFRYFENKIQIIENSGKVGWEVRLPDSLNIDNILYYPITDIISVFDLSNTDAVIVSLKYKPMIHEDTANKDIYFWISKDDGSVIQLDLPFKNKSLLQKNQMYSTYFTEKNENEITVISEEIGVCDENSSNDIIFYSYNKKNPTSVKDLGIQNSFEVYPNPATNFLTISLSPSYLPYQIYDSKGSLVLHGNSAQSPLDISFLDNGFYMIMIGNSIAKFIVNK